MKTMKMIVMMRMRIRKIVVMMMMVVMILMMMIIMLMMMMIMMMMVMMVMMMTGESLEKNGVVEEHRFAALPTTAPEAMVVGESVETEANIEMVGKL